MSRTLSSILNQAELVPQADANDIPYVPFGDLHYQVGTFSTLNKAPNFYN